MNLPSSATVSQGREDHNTSGAVFATDQHVFSQVTRELRRSAHKAGVGGVFMYTLPGYKF